MKNYLLHRFLLVIMKNTVGLYIKLRLRYKCKREKGPFSPTIIISNHNTDFDPSLIVSSFTRHMYFLASEHAFRKGLFSKFLKFVFDPIPFNKVQADTASLKEMFSRLKAGCSVGLFAEGNRSYNGLTGRIPLSTAKLVKMSGAALITYRLEGGYFSTPRWGKGVRRGQMSGRVMSRYSADELKAMTAEQVFEIIKRDIHEDAYQRQKEIFSPIRYTGKNLAEHIETVLYLCPLCKQMGSIRSQGGEFFCGCGLRAVYTETGFLEPAAPEGKAPPFDTITEWDKWQSEQLSLFVNTAAAVGTEQVLCSDTNQKLFVVTASAGLHQSSFVAEGDMHISCTEFHCAGRTFPLPQITRFAVIDSSTLIFALKDGAMYEIHSNTPRCALKYIEILRILRNEND